MGAFSIWHILVLGAIALLLFGGRFKISDMMGDLGKGISSFRKGLSEHDTPPAKLPPDTQADGTKKD
ncbi:MAG TPA: twin-arginine translocase TatA/TatE family subunit [Rhizomicrobium sp.]|nr:twin-arginine translocase TatA/TatE family subunit [Rhizomicrobium sp.]